MGFQYCLSGAPAAASKIHICGMPRTLSGLEGSPPVNRVGYGNA
jgi:hypothetical protein